MVNSEIIELLVITTLIFSIAPIALLIYISLYNKRKKKHIEEREKLHQANEELIKAQHEIREQTMQTIGADLHDNIGQILSLTALTLKSIRTEEPDKIFDKVNSATALVSRSIQEMRQLGSLLQGNALVAKGLDEAIKQEINWLEKSGTYTITYINEGKPTTTIDSNTDLILFRVVQESLNNIIKHAMANQIKIALTYLPQYLQLEIVDNGIGFNINSPSITQNGMGLKSICKRTGLLGGDTVISSTPNQGTTVSILVPYP